MQKLTQITAADALALCNKTESDFYDHKSAAVGARQVEKIAVAFSNADGGEFIVGISDEKTSADPLDRWAGCEKVEDYNPIIQCLYALAPAIDFTYEYLAVPGRVGVVLRVFVARNGSVCKTSDGTIYQRQNASSIPIKDPDKITALSFAKGASTFEDYPLTTLDPEIVVESTEARNFCNELTPKQSTLAYCVNEALIDKNFQPICAGLLLFGDNPQPHFPRRCGAKVVFYDTRNDVPDREHLKKNIAIEGCLYSQIHKIVDAISSIMSSISIMTAEGLKRVGYPPEAIWEVVANAVIHRDYSVADDIQVNISQNRIVVRSPGRLPGFVTTENYLDVRYSRNPKIVRTLARYKNPPNKDLGEGLNTAFEKMKEWRLQSPKLVEVGGYVEVTLPHTPLASPEELVLEYLGKHGEIRNAVARELTGIRSENQMKEVFYRLRDRGLIERVEDLKGNKAAWKKK